MAITVVGVGAVDALTPFQPAFAGPVLADDILLVLVEQASLTSPDASPTATGFAHVLGSPVGPDSAQTVLSVLWKRAIGGEANVSVSGPSNHGVTRAITIRGVKTTGNPWNVNPAVTTIANGTTATATWLSVVTTVADCLVCLCLADGRDSTAASMGAVTNGSLTSITEQMDNFTNVGTGGGIGLATGFKAAAGAVGASTATMATTDGMALLTLALEPAAGPPVGLAPPPDHPNRRIIGLLAA